MPTNRHCPRIDTYQLKLQIERKIGQQRAEKYFTALSKYLSLKLSKSEFEKFCIGLLGRDNICLHNALMRAIIKNACAAKTPPLKNGTMQPSINGKVPNGCQRGTLQSLCRDVFPRSPRKGRTPTLRDRRFKDRSCPLRPHWKTHSVACEDNAPKAQEHQSATEWLSLGSTHSRSHVTAPLGISLSARGTRKVVCHRSAPLHGIETCNSTRELPDSSSLKKWLEQKSETEGVQISTDAIKVLNSGLDVFLKRLIKPCLDLAGSKSQHKRIHDQALSVSNKTRPIKYIQKPSDLFSVSMLDFRSAMELNPRILGEDSRIQLEKVSLHAYEESLIN
ncbi:uncharacterized protein LOC129875031 [Solanum dulcamara]|uniref:uncharacterized protein LOC129875031 n=1 Tax=Solanum dulcamara TaxID=45834 RepID=UPI002484F7A0|nr:uncharacterized protein LOC129875031 [Solanum dulcamara]XP_055806441.1 uncharacterized protein LOC129875031 [Solanum dulcamara]